MVGHRCRPCLNSTALKVKTELLSLSLWAPSKSISALPVGELCHPRNFLVQWKQLESHLLQDFVINTSHLYFPSYPLQWKVGAPQSRTVLWELHNSDRGICNSFCVMVSKCFKNCTWINDLCWFFFLCLVAYSRELNKSSKSLLSRIK